MGKVKFLCALLLIMHICTIFCVPVSAVASISTEAGPQLNSAAAYLVDLETQSVLFAQNADEIREPASLTKVMTALLALEYGSLDQTLTVSQSALDALAAYDTAAYSTTASLEVGEQLTLRSLLYCILVASSSDACCVVAEAVSGSVDAFVERMNERAQELGCENTQFKNPHGLHAEGHYTTAADMARITTAALQHDTFIDICNTASVEIPATNLHDRRYLKTTNYLLSTNTVGGYVYNRACGVKTGYTSQAGYCLISTAKNSRMSLLGVVMGAEATDNGDGTYTIQSFKDMVNLFEYGFRSFTSVSLLSTLDVIAEMPVTLAAAGSNTAVLSPVRSVSAMLPADYDAALIQRTVHLAADQVEAPVEAGQVLGSVSIYYDNQLVDTVDLAAIAPVERSQLQVWKQTLLRYWESPWVRLVCLAVGVLFVLFLVRLALPRRRRSR